MGFPRGKAIGLALAAAQAAAQNGDEPQTIRAALQAVLNAPSAHADDAVYGQIAGFLVGQNKPDAAYRLDHYAPYRIWGKAQIEQGALTQMEHAVRLPVSIRGALMPDAHQGYGLPIGGVLATHNAVIPYAVGVDIACRMRMTIFDASPHVLEQKRDKFRKAIEANTRFGTGETWDTPRQHPVMDDPAWREHPVARQFKDTAWKQLGTSGSGNHFVEFGSLDVREAIPVGDAVIEPGKYLALLSHSGSRRLGYEMANHYTQIAMNSRKALPKDYLHLAWLDLDGSAGAEYWAAMTLAGKYASANHAIIHRQIVDSLRFDVLGSVENHHNFAWKEMVDGVEAIVHRKGATPAGKGILGVIPGSMSAPGFLVRGKGLPESINSAAHGAGRRMSRGEALKRYEWPIIHRKLKAEGVELLSGGLDEAPGAYKDIRVVMAEQADLVDILAEFQPRLVKMDPGGKKPGYFRED
ncbi:MAG: RtcB family protein [Anaerolineae bacterium]|nr:RtcB family protein [Anaerolineae bacterium]